MQRIVLFWNNIKINQFLKNNFEFNKFKLYICCFFSHYKTFLRIIIFYLLIVKGFNKAFHMNSTF